MRAWRVTSREPSSESQIIEREASAARAAIRRKLSDLNDALGTGLRRPGSRILLLGGALAAAGAGAFVMIRRLRRTSNHTVTCDPPEPTPGLPRRILSRVGWLVAHAVAGAWITRCLEAEGDSERPGC